MRQAANHPEKSESESLVSWVGFLPARSKPTREIRERVTRIRESEREALHLHRPREIPHTPLKAGVEGGRCGQV